MEKVQWNLINKKQNGPEQSKNDKSHRPSKISSPTFPGVATPVAVDESPN